MDIRVGDNVMLKEETSMETGRIMTVKEILPNERIRAIYWYGKYQHDFICLEGDFRIFRKIDSTFKSKENTEKSSKFTFFKHLIYWIMEYPYMK